MIYQLVRTLKTLTLHVRHWFRDVVFAFDAEENSPGCSFCQFYSKIDLTFFWFAIEVFHYYY